MACCQPPKGQTYLTIGQDLFSIQDYIQIQYNYSLHAYMMENEMQIATMEQLANNQTQNDFDILPRRIPRIPSIPPTVSNSLPAAVMVYTDIQTLKGLDMPTDYGSGVEYANGLFASLYRSSNNDHHQQQQQPGRRRPQQRYSDSGGNGAGLQIGLWLNGTFGCRDIVNGILDGNIHRLLHYIVTSPFEYIFLRVGYEFDNPAFGYYTSNSNDGNDDDDNDDPSNVLFQQAYRYIVQACRNHEDHDGNEQQLHQSQQHHQQRRAGEQQEDSFLQSSYSLCMTKTIFVWHSWAASLTTSHQLARYYPGNDYVDWIGISLFSQLYNNNTTPNGIDKLGSRETVQAVLDFANQPSIDKPVMIAESTPFGGIPNLVDPWQDWFIPVLQLISTNHISMWSYIHCDWNRQPMWHDVGFGDSRLNVNLTVMQEWQQHVMQNDARFLQHGSLSRYCDTNQRRRRRDGGDGGPRRHVQHYYNNRTFPVVTTSSISHGVDAVTKLLFTTDDKTWHAPAAVSWLDIEMAWVAGLGIGLFVMILGSCQYYWRTSNSRSKQNNDSIVNFCDYQYQMLMDNDGKQNDYKQDDERQALVKPNRTGYGSMTRNR
jgi:hypothetical protein